MSADTLTLQRILQIGYAAYERSHAVPAHVRRAVWVRCWGRYAHTHSAKLALCQRQLAPGPRVAPASVDRQRADEGWGELHPERCPICGQRLVCTALIPRAGAPLPLERMGEQVA